MNPKELRELAKFIVVGVSNTLIGLMVIYIAKWAFHVSDAPANAIGYAVGIVVSFSLHSRWTFAYRGPQRDAFIKFLLVALVAYGMNLLVVMLLIHRAGLNSYLAQAVGIPVYTVVSYVSSKYFVFRSGGPPLPRN